MTWADPQLTETGIRQAEGLGNLLAELVRTAGLPLPGTVYTSPLARCLETTRLVWTPPFASSSPSPPPAAPVAGADATTATSTRLRPLVKERLRERMAPHTCDRRGERGTIANRYPDYVLEADMAEGPDPLWKAHRDETDEQHVARKQALLEEVFANDDATFVALNTHLFAISAILGVLDAPRFLVAEGALVPLLVKATKVGEER